MSARVRCAKPVRRVREEFSQVCRSFRHGSEEVFPQVECVAHAVSYAHAVAVFGHGCLQYGEKPASACDTWCKTAQGSQEAMPRFCACAFDVFDGGEEVVHLAETRGRYCHVEGDAVDHPAQHFFHVREARVPFREFFERVYLSAIDVVFIVGPEDPVDVVK